MAAQNRPLPPQWSREELGAQRRDSIDAFITWWETKGVSSYRRHYTISLGAVIRLFEATNDLADLGPSTLEDVDRDMRDVVRYLAGPPLSEDDLKIVTGARTPWTRTTLPRVTEVIKLVLDRERFPWLSEPVRLPTTVERQQAQRWTAGLLAAQKAATERRLESSRRQEQAVDSALQRAPSGFQKVLPRDIRSVRDIDPGQYCRESMAGGTRADIVVGLRDRILLIECKVSNSEVNSYKRLNHEVGDKAARWRSAFGEQAIAAAVLAGVFSLDNLVAAQSAGISIFWEHNLEPLIEFVLSSQ